MIISTLPLTFVTIVETGSITLAADELNIAKSAISQNLKRLEEQLNVKLATRTTRKLTLTPAGERYYLRCKEILTLAKVASTEMEDFGAAPSGPIKITAPHAMMTPIIAPAISRVLKKYPQLIPSIIADDKRLDLVTSGIDLSVTVGKLEDSTLRARKIGELRDILCACPSILKSAGKEEFSETLKSVSSLPYIAHTREQSSIEHKLQPLHSGRSLYIEFKPAIFSNTIEALVTLTKKGLGVALLPEFAVSKELEHGTLVKLFPGYQLETKNIFAVHAYDTKPPKSITEVIESIQIELNKTTCIPT